MDTSRSSTRRWTTRTRTTSTRRTTRTRRSGTRRRPRRVQQGGARPAARERGGQRHRAPALQPGVPQRGLQGQLDVRLARTHRTTRRRLRQLQTRAPPHAPRRALQRRHPAHRLALLPPRAQQGNR
jgi:hypothetical protein